MDTMRKMPEALRSVCERWSDAMAEISGYEGRLAYVRRVLPDLLLDGSIFSGVLKNVMDGAQYPDIRQATMFDNEMLLYTDRKRIFSIRLYLWGPGDYTPIHDHNAWGVIGPVMGKLQVTRFTREDTGTDESTARLKQSDDLILTAGQTEVVLPLNNGIHRTGNPGDLTSATVHLYGNPVRRTYVNSFDLESGQITRIYAPRARKRMLASEALRSLEAHVQSGRGS